jgi:hypothetical protein
MAWHHLFSPHDIWEDDHWHMARPIFTESDIQLGIKHSEPVRLCVSGL